MPPFGELPGGKQADSAGLFQLQAALTDLLSPEMRFTSEHKRSATEKDEEIVFYTFFCFFTASKEAPVCL